METGYQFEIRNRVTEEDVALTVGSGDLSVLATPRLLAWLEECCWRAVAEQIQEAASTVGTSVQLSHLAASGLGAEVVCRAELVEVDRKRLRFAVEAHEGELLVARGELERFIVDRDSFLAKLADRKA